MAPGIVSCDQEKPHVRSTASLLSESKGQVAVPDRYIWEEDLRDAIFTRRESFGARASQADRKLPIIDLSLAHHSDVDRKKLAKQIGKAAADWGFFQVINHGVPEAVINEMEAHGKDFFSKLPVEVKELGVETDPSKHTYYHGYGGRFQHLEARVPWLEYLGECYHPVNGADVLLKKIWPVVGNREFCDATEEYSKALVQMGRLILEVLAESLGLSSEFFSQHFSDTTKYQAHWRFNQYPACPQPSKTMGLGPHTDPCALTIVKQDMVGGFQLRKGGHWFDVQPMDKSFLVNIGDCLQAWSNGRFISVLHRALVNDHADRLSIVFPFSPSADLEIVPPSSLIDDEHPLLFPTPVVWNHLAVIKGNHVVEEALTNNFGLKSTK